MKNCALMLTFAFVLAGCGEQASETESGDQPSPPSTAPADSSSSLPTGSPAIELVALESETVEIGCGACIYHMPGVNACKTAVVIKDVPVLVRGEAEDAHALGLCSEAKTAVVSGKVEGGHVVTTEVELQ